MKVIQEEVLIILSEYEELKTSSKDPTGNFSGKANDILLCLYNVYAFMRKVWPDLIKNVWMEHVPYYGSHRIAGYLHFWIYV